MPADKTDSPLESVFSSFKGIEGITIPVLQEIQSIYGYLPVEALERMSLYFKMPLSAIYGVATFYAQFKFTKPGRYMIKVCHGTACHINNAVSVSETIQDYLKIKAGETDPEGRFSLEEVACLGCCSLAPVMMINETVYGNLDQKKILKVLKEYERND